MPKTVKPVEPAPKSALQAEQEKHASMAAAPFGGSVVSGVAPNRDHKSFPDEEQKRRHAGRQESRWAAGEIKTHPVETRATKNNPPSE